MEPTAHGLHMLTFDAQRERRDRTSVRDAQDGTAKHGPQAIRRNAIDGDPFGSSFRRIKRESPDF
jgi:hypothetical protein